MSRMVSLIVLVVILIAIAIIFFDVMSSFILPIFLALLLVVIFRPLQHWITDRCKGHVRIAAGLTTLTILFIVLIPLVFLLWQATLQAISIYEIIFEGAGDPPGAAKRANIALNGDKTQESSKNKAAKNTTSHDNGKQKTSERAIDRLTGEVVQLSEKMGMKLAYEDVRPVLENTVIPKLKSWMAPLAVRSTHFAARFVVGLCIMVISLYYFFADGPAMMETLRRLLPLDKIYVTELIEEFDKVSRAVVLATLISAVVQGLLAGLGYYFAGFQSVFLLMFLTMLMAMIPFVGATGVWLPACLWLAFYDERIFAAVVLFLYGALVVSLVDNLLKPFILHGAANLHPLLALMSVLGGVEALGPIGIFVGPMVVAFMQALLVMVQKELERIRTKESEVSKAQAVT
ncbi:MAG: AI-2E family transporter [Pirellulales bacterium]|nr:AI-2E family transporter [Pirellulales bacterium]